jgi:hypothetical protein
MISMQLKLASQTAASSSVGSAVTKLTDPTGSTIVWNVGVD